MLGSHHFHIVSTWDNYSTFIMNGTFGCSPIPQVVTTVDGFAYLIWNRLPAECPSSQNLQMFLESTLRVH